MISPALISSPSSTLSTRIQNTIKQLQQVLEAKQLDRKTLQFSALHFQNDFGLLRYLLFSSVGNISLSYNCISRSTMQPTKKPKPKPRPILVDTLPTTVDKPPTSRFTPEGDVRPRRAKVTNSASADLQSSLNTQEARPTTLQNFTSGIAKLENLFANEIATYL